MSGLQFQENEKGASGTTTPHHFPGFGHHPNAERRFHQLIHPLSGKKTHIASSPEEAQRLERTLSTIDAEEEFDIVIHGSPEHVETLREHHSRYDEQNEALQTKHADVYKEFTRIRDELDHLNAELNSISDHAIQLDANFSKYGYSAHIRTHDQHSPNNSSANSLHGDRTPSIDSNSAMQQQRDMGQAMKFFVKPICRQYFHKGLIWRAQDAEETASYELFLDLIYVGIIAISGDAAAEQATAHALLRFAITFILAWRIWTDVSISMNWFDADDIIRRITVLILLTCLLGYTTNIVEFLGETYVPGISFFIAARYLHGLVFLWYAYLIPMIRPTMIGQAIFVVIPSVFWIASTHFEGGSRQAFIWLGIAFDIGGSVLLIFVHRGTFFTGKLKEKVVKLFEFYPAINIEHRIDRTGAFVSLVFGYSVVALLYQSSAQVGLNGFFGKAVLGLIQAFCFNWLYFEIDSYNLHTHAIRRHAISSLLWFTMHLPFILAFVLAGAALSKMVLLHDIPECNPEDLAEFSIAKSHADFTTGLRWFYCAGLGIALLSMNVISLTHVYKLTVTPTSRTPKFLEKPVRLGVRTVIGIILICLGLADSLNSLTVIATTTGLIVFALAFELFGNIVVCGGCWMKNERKCAYGAKCHISKKDLESHVKKGTVVKVDDLRGEKAGTVGIH